MTSTLTNLSTTVRHRGQYTGLTAATHSRRAQSTHNLWEHACTLTETSASMHMGHRSALSESDCIAASPASPKLLPQPRLRPPSDLRLRRRLCVKLAKPLRRWDGRYAALQLLYPATVELPSMSCAATLAYQLRLELKAAAAALEPMPPGADTESARRGSGWPFA